MEKFFYEYKPNFYLAIAIYAIVLSHQSQIALTCGFVLLACGAYIKKMRSHYRTQLDSRGYQIKK